LFKQVHQKFIPYFSDIPPIFKRLKTASFFFTLTDVIQANGGIIKMKKHEQTFLYDVVNDNLALMSKIYQSFEALEQTLGALQMEEPLLMTYAAKKSFAQSLARLAKLPTYRQ
jgi:hypothetical protein